MTKIKIVYVNGGLMKRGGIESFMMNYFRNINSQLIHIDFIVHGDGKGVYDEEIESCGSKIFHVPIKSKHPIKYGIELKRIFKKNHYDIVHSHLDAMGCWVLKIAKECGINIRIAHSHNIDHLTNNKIKYMINEYARKRICRYATHRFACSYDAGKWLFGDCSFKIIKNAVNIKKFVYSKQTRISVRQELNIADNQVVIGHVGRFDTQKNHKFLIELFNIIAHENDKYKLLLIGDGWLMKNVKSMIDKFGISDCVIFTGTREDADRLYNAMDIFVLPSLFEGLGMVAIEARINGLKTFVSDKVPEEVKIDEYTRHLPLDLSLWKEEILTATKNIERYPAKNIDEYDIEKAAQKLTKLYINMVR